MTDMTEMLFDPAAPLKPSGNLRRRQIMSAFLDSNDPHKGAYWGIQADMSQYSAPAV